MLPHSLTRVAAPLAANAPARPLDVLRIKSALAALGHYAAPDWGVTPYPDRDLFDAVKAFQRERGLTVDGRMKPEGETGTALAQALTPQAGSRALAALAEAVRALGRNGDTVLAHITPEEAALLDAVTDGVSVNPATGLPEFWHDYEADAYGVGDSSQNTGPDRSDRNNDANDRRKDGGVRQLMAQAASPQSQGDMIKSTDASKTTVSKDDGVNRAQRQAAHAARGFGAGDSYDFFDQTDNDANAGYDVGAASDDQAVENDYQRSEYAVRDRNDPAGYGDMRTVDAVNAARRERQRILRQIRSGTTTASPTVQPQQPYTGPSVTIDLPLTPEQRRHDLIVEKAKRLGIDPELIDTSSPFDRNLIDGLYGVDGKAPEEKDKVARMRERLRGLAMGDARYSQLNEQVKTSYAKTRTFPGFQNHGYYTDEHLSNIVQTGRNAGVGFKIGGRVVPPFDVIGDYLSGVADAAEEERKYRKSLLEPGRARR